MNEYWAKWQVFKWEKNVTGIMAGLWHWQVANVNDTFLRNTG